YLRARAHAVVAEAMAKSKPREALALLDEAFALLAGRVASGADSFNNFYNAASLGCLLLGVAEQIDPALVTEFFWRALSFHAPNAAKDQDDRWGMRAAAVGSLALAVAHYDRDIALALLDTVQVPRLDTNFAGVSVFRAAALA